MRSTLDPNTMPVLHWVFALAAQGLTDREVAKTTGLKKKHVAELLTNRIYIGELRGGGRRAPVIDREVREQAQAKRVRHAHRAPGPVIRQPYVLSGLLHCRACGHSITGHSGRYRHEEGCARFRAARSEAFWDKRGKGDSYKAEIFDGVVPGALVHRSASADLVADVADYVESLPAPVNELALQRIRRARDRATERLIRDRDTAAWNAEMKRLDAEEAEAKASAAIGPTRSEVAAHLADLARLYDRAEPETRQRIAQALFAKVEVLGPTKVWLHPSEEAAAQGWATAMSGEFTAQIRRNGRGERARADTPSPSLIIPVANVPSYGYREVPGRMGPRSGRCSAGTHRPLRPLRLASEGRSEAPTAERARGHRLQDEAVAGRARDADPAGTPASSPHRTVRPGPTRQ